MMWTVEVALICQECGEKVAVNVDLTEWPTIIPPDHFCQTRAEKWTGDGGGNGSRSNSRVQVDTKSDIQSDIQEFLDLCQSTLDVIDQFPIDLPREGHNFATSVGAKVLSMMVDAERRGSYTEGMMTAVNNMRSGAERWLR